MMRNGHHARMSEVFPDRKNAYLHSTISKHVVTFFFSTDGGNQGEFDIFYGKPDSITYARGEKKVTL